MWKRIFVSWRKATSRRTTILSDSLPLLIHGAIERSSLYEFKGIPIYVGIELDTRSAVFWDLGVAPNANVLAVGPSGTGKTETLSTLVARMRKVLGVGALIVDLKGEYAEKLRNKGIDDVIHVKLGLSKIDICSEQEINSVTEIIEKVYRIPTEAIGVLRTSIEEIICGSSVSLPIDALIDRITSSMTTVFDSNGIDVNSLIRESLRRPVVLDLSPVMYVDNRIAVVASLHVLNELFKYCRREISETPRIAIVIDEAWRYMVSPFEEFLCMLARFGRSYGVSLMIATQSPEDIPSMLMNAIEGFGLIVALANPSRSYWLSIARLFHMNRSHIDKALSLSNIGEGVVRFLPLRKPFFVYVDIEEQ